MRVRFSVDAKKYQSTLTRIGRNTSPERMTKTMKKVGIQMLSDIHGEYKKHSDPNDSFWKKVSPVTAFFRAGGRGKRVKSFSDFNKLGKDANKMVDTRGLESSLFPRTSSKDGVFKNRADRVEVGTAHENAADLHGGADAVFEFDDEKQSIFDKRVGKGKSQKIAAFRTELGNIFRGMDGEVFDVPARPIIDPKYPDSRQNQRLLKIVFGDTISDRALGKGKG